MQDPYEWQTGGTGLGAVVVDGAGMLHYYIEYMCRQTKAHPVIFSLLGTLLKWATSDEAKRFVFSEEDAVTWPPSSSDHKSNSWHATQLSLYHDLTNAIGGLHALLQMAIKSFRNQQKVASDAASLDEFRSSLLHCLSGLGALMSVSVPPWLAPLQLLALEGFYPIFNLLSASEILSRNRLVLVATSFVGSARCALEMDGPMRSELSLAKLHLIRQFVEAGYLRLSEWRLPLLKVSIDALRPHFSPSLLEPPSDEVASSSSSAPSSSSASLSSTLAYVWSNGLKEKVASVKLLMDTLRELPLTPPTPMVPANPTPQYLQEMKELEAAGWLEPSAENEKLARHRLTRLLSVLCAMTSSALSHRSDGTWNAINEDIRTQFPELNFLGECVTTIISLLYRLFPSQTAFHEALDQALLPSAECKNVHHNHNQQHSHHHHHSHSHSSSISHHHHSASLSSATLSITVSQPPTPSHHHVVVHANRSSDDVCEAEFLLSLMEVCRYVTEQSVYNKYWLTLRMKELRLSLDVVRWTSPRLQANFLGAQFNATLWKLYATVCMSMLSCDEANPDAWYHHTANSLIVNKEARNEIIAKGFGCEPRLAVAEQLRQDWIFLGPKQIALIPVLVGPLIELDQSPCVEVQSLARDFFFNLLLREFEASKNFLGVQNHTIDTVGRLCHKYGTTGSHMLEKYTQFFNTHLSQEFMRPQNESLKDVGLSFLKDINELFAHIMSLESLPANKRFEDERTSACINLIKYLEDSGKVEMCRKYLHYLSDLHKSIGNCVEWGKALLMQQKSIPWGEDILDAEDSYPVQSQSQRKMMLMQQAIQAFDQAKYWEMSVSVQQQLCEVYEKTLLDLSQLTFGLRAQADYWDKISTQDRIFPAFYRVVTFGPGFPPEKRGQEFIYRSGDGVNPESVREFMIRMKERYPGAEVNANPPPKALLDACDPSASDETKELASKLASQWVQVTTVQCSSEEEMNGQPSRFSHLFEPPLRVMHYHKNNNLRVFSYTRVSKEHQQAAAEREANSASTSSNSKPSNEFRNLWMVRTFLVASEALPSVRRRVEVSERREVVMCPVENAVYNIVTKNNELRDLIRSMRDNRDEHPATGPLSMQLQGVIDAAVQGGVTKYREAFFDGSYLQTYPEHAPFLNSFREALAQQLDILKMGLDVFASKCDKSLLPLSDFLKGRYAQMVTDLTPLIETGF